MKLTRTLPLLAVMGLLAATVFAPLTVGAQETSPANRGALNNIPVSGPLSTVAAGATGAIFDGRLSIDRFEVINDQLVAAGTVSGRLLDAAGNPIGNLQGLPVSVPVLFGEGLTAATCDILNLDLGAINLDLLGLVLDISPISVDLTAQPGAGNLLGNLLCGIAGLLDAPELDLGALADLLNQIIGA